MESIIKFRLQRKKNGRICGKNAEKLVNMFKDFSTKQTAQLFHRGDPKSNHP